MLKKKRLNATEAIKINPSFLSNLFEILNTSSYNNIIRWNSNGNGLIIIDSRKLTEIILPKYYKHKNYSSFIRQLNNYCFYKRKGISNLGEEFEHKEFNEYCSEDDIKNIMLKYKSQRNPVFKTLNKNKITENLNIDINDMSESIKKLEEISKAEKEFKSEINRIKIGQSQLMDQIKINNKNIEKQDICLRKIKYLFFILIFLLVKKKQKNSKVSNKFNFKELLENFYNLRNEEIKETANNNNFHRNNQEKHVESFSINEVKKGNSIFNYKKNEDKDPDDSSYLNDKNDYFLNNSISNLRNHRSSFSYDCNLSD